MVFVAELFGSWLIGQVADEGRKRLTTLVLGSDQERALLRAAAMAVQPTAAELRPEGGEQAQHLAMVVDQVFSWPAIRVPNPTDVTLLEAIKAGIAGQLAPLGDAELTGTRKSSAELLRVQGPVLAEKLTDNLLREIFRRGSGGGPLTPLANQLNHDKTHLHGREVLEALTGRKSGPAAAAVAPVTHTLPADVPSFAGRQAELRQLMKVLPDSETVRGVVRIAAVDGMAGVGKPTPAPTWASCST